MTTVHASTEAPARRRREKGNRQYAGGRYNVVIGTPPASFKPRDVADVPETLSDLHPMFVRINLSAAQYEVREFNWNAMLNGSGQWAICTFRPRFGRGLPKGGQP